MEANLAKLGKLPFTKQAKRVYAGAAEKVQKRAKELAPYDEGRMKGTHLRDAIVIGYGPLGLSDVVVAVRYKRPGAPHSHLIEFGTVKMRARPFMRPAAAQMAGAVGAKLKQDMLDLITGSVK